MAGSGFNIGQDIVVDLVNTTLGVTYSFSKSGGDLLHFEADPMSEVIRRRPITNGGRSKRRVERPGWKGAMEIGRVNGDFEALEIQMQQAYRQGDDDFVFDIHTTVKNADGTGTTSEYVYSSATLWMSKGPSFTLGEDVKFSFEFECDDCTQIA